MLIYAVDPGTTSSALVVYDPARQLVTQHVHDENGTILYGLKHAKDLAGLLVVEQIEAMGMVVGAEVFETVWWAGRFHQAWQGTAYRLPRRAVKLHICQDSRAKDTNIRQALLDKFGPGKAVAIGSKDNPGPLYGLRSHEYAALAIAVTWAETHV